MFVRWLATAVIVAVPVAARAQVAPAASSSPSPAADATSSAPDTVVPREPSAPPTPWWDENAAPRAPTSSAPPVVVLPPVLPPAIPSPLERPAVQPGPGAFITSSRIGLHIVLEPALMPERRTVRRNPWQPWFQCETPCDVPLDPGAYQIFVRGQAGERNMRGRLQVNQSRVFVSIDPPRSVVAPVLGIAGGAITMITGVVLAIEGATPSGFYEPHIDTLPHVASGLTLMVASAAVLAVSIVAFQQASRGVHVSDTPGAPIPSPQRSLSPRPTPTPVAAPPAETHEAREPRGM